MALQALNACVATGINNTAELLNTVIHYADIGVRAWGRNSDGVWITSAVVYYATLLESQKGWVGVKTANEIDLAKKVAIGISTFVAAYAMIRGGKQKADDPAKGLVDIPAPSYTRQFSLAFTNAAVITLYVAQRLKLNVPPVQAFVATVVPYFLTSMALSAYFKEAPATT